MSDTGHITLSGPDLQLFVPSTDPAADPLVPVYDFVQDGLTPGGVVKRRQIAESMYMDDAFQVQSSKARIPATFNFFVTGWDTDSLQTNLEALCDAVDQSTWELHVLFGGVTEYAWSCWDAETTPGFPVATWYGVYLPLVVSTLRSPTPVAGPI